MRWLTGGRDAGWADIAGLLRFAPCTMGATSRRWQAIADSEFLWEREALAFVRDRLPDHEPYRSRPGLVEGDPGTCTWRLDGRVHTADNPLLLANRKARKLISLLRRRPVLRKVASPFLEAHVFLPHKDVDCRLPQHLLDRVHLCDRGSGRDERPGIVAPLTRHGADAAPCRRPDRPLASGVSRAVQEAGIRPSQRIRRVGDYRLGELLFEGANYQDWTATHAAIESESARVRIYGTPRGVSDDERTGLQRAAEREYRILRDVRHDGILAAKTYTEHVLGPELVFEHRAGAQRRDHRFAEHAARLDVDTRVHLLRQIAEAVCYAHENHMVHRALSPQSILVLDPDAALPRVQVFNWQTGARAAPDSGTAGPVTSGATGLEALAEDQTWVYMAPEVVTERGSAGEQLDVFSLGAIAYHLFEGRPPACNLLEMTERLRREQGLQLSSVVDGAGEPLQLLVQHAAYPEVTARLESVREFLDEFERFQEEITRPEEVSWPDPVDARPGDELEHGIVVMRRLGKGATALALLVEREGREQVLKPIDGKPVPVFTTAQWARIPSAWIAGRRMEKSS